MPPKLDRAQRPAPVRISQQRMRDFQELEANFKILKIRYEEEKKALTSAALDPKTIIEDGRLEAVAVAFETRRPKWKEEFIAVAGQDEADKIIANTEPSTSWSVDIRVKPTVGC